MAQNPCALCGEHENLPKQEVCAICANDSDHASERFSEEAVRPWSSDSQEFSDEEPVGTICGPSLDEVDWDEEHRRAQESGEMFEDEDEYSYY